MNDIVKSNVSVDKGFFRKERDQFYGNWTIAFWRELFQNSVDAGAKRIAIELRQVDARGSFGNPGAGTGTVTNVVFSDDGHGMTADVLGEVYFKMGKSTKDADGSTIGGFGRARIMTCFSQERYTILTRDRFVVGEGDYFEHGSLGQQLVEMEKYEAALEASGEPGAAASLSALRSDMEMVRQAWTRRGGYPGCRVEVDLDASEPRNWRARPGTMDNMEKALREYLSESQLPCEVTINGKSPEDHYGITDGRLQARKGPVRRTLTVPAHDGGTEQFATVHLSEGKKAAFKGSMVVRVSGASMFRKDISGLDAQVIVEIDPSQSRDALNSNRDGFKGDYDSAVDRLITDLTIDTMTALKDRSSKVEEIGGTEGHIVTAPPDLDNAVKKDLTFEEEDRIVETMGKLPRITSYEAIQNIGIHQDVLRKFLEQAYYGSSFLNTHVIHNGDRGDELNSQLRELRDALYTERRKPDWFFQNAGEKAKAWVLSSLSMRMDEVRRQWQAEQESKITGVHDIYINMESTNAKTRAAAKRHHPSAWDVTTGSGKAMRSLLAVWTAACNVCMEALYQQRPGLSPAVWSTGFVYSLPEETAQGDGWRDVATKAQCVLRPDGQYRLLLNPVNEDGTLRYSLTNEKDLIRILALAKHEVAHLVESYHNETYANALTDVDGEVDQRAAFRKMKAELAAVTAAYAEGRARVHRLDDEPGPRPAERLLAAACGNDREAASGALRWEGGRTATVDTETAYDIPIEDAAENNEQEPRHGMAGNWR